MRVRFFSRGAAGTLERIGGKIRALPPRFTYLTVQLEFTSSRRLGSLRPLNHSCRVDVPRRRPGWVAEFHQIASARLTVRALVFV